jgi:hypothetical protein
MPDNLEREFQIPILLEYGDAASRADLSRVPNEKPASHLPPSSACSPFASRLFDSVQSSEPIGSADRAASACADQTEVKGTPGGGGQNFWA